MRLNRRLRDLVPVVLNRSVPEPPDELLVRRSGGAVGDAQRLHFVEDRGVLGAGQCRRRPRAELLGALEGERGYSRPMREYWLLREIGRCRLVVSGGVSKDKRNRCRRRPIVAAQSQGGQRNRSSDVDSGGFVRTVGDL